jgi:2-polyprenyl-6-methoxyphenol hydroxylase-like FAD-dependent oxidoreductase
LIVRLQIAVQPHATLFVLLRADLTSGVSAPKDRQRMVVQTHPTAGPDPFFGSASTQAVLHSRLSRALSGAGIAGPCLAYWLRRHGFEPTIVERAPRLRTGGYVIDFWGTGFDIAERMGLKARVLESGYKLEELRQVDRRGRRVGGFPIDVFDRMTNGRYTSLPRSALARCIYDALDAGVETIFDDTVVRVDEAGPGLLVHFERAPARAFDLVVGADGLHSPIRQLVFGEESQFEHFLGLKVAAFEADGYRPRDELVYVVHREVGQQVGRFSMRSDRTMFLFVFADRDPALPADVAEQRALLRKTYSESGWECPGILEALGRAESLYMDRVSQIRMEGWAHGRVALVGDAAFCVSFLAGQGSALAMVGAYVLAGELKRANGDHEVAFARYQNRLKTFVAAKQKAAVKFTSFFAPRSRTGMFLGNQVTKLMSIPFVSELAIGRDLRDALELPEY